MKTSHYFRTIYLQKAFSVYPGFSSNENARNSDYLSATLLKRFYIA